MARRPAAVTRQEKAAEALMKQQTEAREGAPEAAAISKDGAPAEPTKQAAPAEPTKQAAPAEPAKQAAPAEPAASMSPVPSPDEDQWEQRYRSLLGRFEAEIGRAQGRIRELEQAMAQQPPAQPAAPGSEAPEFDDAEDVENYGQDFVDMVNRRAAAIAHKQVTKLMTELQPKLQNVEKGLGETRRQSAAERVQAALDRDVPNWRDVNRSPQFLAWLSTADQMSGFERGKLLRSAYENGDAARVRDIFTIYLREAGAIPATPERRTGVRDRDPLAGLAAPGAPRALDGVPAEPTQQPPLSRDVIQQFYSDVAKGRYKTRPEEYAAMEKRIANAMATGGVS